MAQGGIYGLPWRFLSPHAVSHRCPGRRYPVGMASDSDPHPAKQNGKLSIPLPFDEALKAAMKVPADKPHHAQRQDAQGHEEEANGVLSIVHVCGPPSRWEVELTSGTVVVIWADAYQERDDSFVFEVLVDVDGAVPEFVQVTARTPSNPKRVAVAVASFPARDVDDISGG